MMSAAFETDGYVHLPALLPIPLIDRLSRISVGHLQRADTGHREANRSQRSLINLASDPDYAEIIVCPTLLNCLAGLGFADLRYQCGFLISKPGHSPPLFWHQDWWGWSHPSAYEESPLQIGVMIYLDPTRISNGCLRVVPGTHLRRHPLHDSIPAHDEMLSRVNDPRHRLYQSADGEVALTSNPGDVLVIDARLLHSAYPNNTDNERMLLTLWFHPGWDDIPSGIRAHAANIFNGINSESQHDMMPSPRKWPAESRKCLAMLVPEHLGCLPVEFNRRPDTTRMRHD